LVNFLSNFVEFSFNLFNFGTICKLLGWELNQFIFF